MRRLVQLLTCRCEDCAHWEIIKNAYGTHSLLCKGCDLELPLAKFEIADHDMLHYKVHER